MCADATTEAPRCSWRSLRILLHSHAQKQNREEHRMTDTLWTNCWGDDNKYDYESIVDGLNRYLRLKATPIGMKRFKTVAEMEAIPRIRRQ